MAVLETNAIAGLKPLKWRGLTAHCSEVTCDFSHIQAPLPYAYIDDEGHDWTGRSCFKIGATLLFNNTIETGQYPDLWLRWREAILDGKASGLLHPDLGVVRARVANCSYAIRAVERAGITVRVEWTSTIEKIDEPNRINVGTVSLQAVANECDAAMQALNITYPDGGDGTTSLGQAISGVTGNIQMAATSISGSVTRTIGQIDKLSGTIDQLHDAAEALNTTLAWSFTSNLETLDAALQDTKTQLREGARETSEFVADYDIPLDAFARKFSNTVSEVVQLNPGALGQPAVPKGTPLRYFKAA